LFSTQRQCQTALELQHTDGIVTVYKYQMDTKNTIYIAKVKYKS